MRGDGRTRAHSNVHVFSRLAYLYACIALVTSEFGFPVEIKVWDTGRTPLAYMVDLTNGFGLRVLAEHNFLNVNNIAFSPYGLMGIMVALYEGVEGESSYQIQRGMQLPWNRNVMRVGFRDIHRTLKTYFVPEEGFLAGLALNNENVTFTEQYKKMLRFYGFDLENDQLPTISPETNTTLIMTGTSSSSPNKEETTTTINPNAETVNTIDIREGASTTEGSSLAPNAESTTAQMETTVLKTEATTTAAPEIIETAVTETAPVTLLTSAITNEPTANNEIEMTSVDITTTEETTTETSTIISAGTESLASTQQTEVMSSMSTVTDTATPIMSASTLETLERRKKSVVDFVYPHHPAHEVADEYVYYRSYDDTPNSNNDEDVFLSNGLKNVQVNYMHYDTILEHAYLPHLEASALRLPLDSDRYYLLVLLPKNRGPAGIGRLVSRMARESDLSDIYSELRPQRVKGIVPSFVVKGHVTLTTDLQKLGIRDVFEPRQTDFTLMTKQTGVYVRSIEQAVSVAIRKYKPDETKKNRFVINPDPVVFSATYPFIYFVMDAQIHVALMAGKMVDPLNSRIL